jgi:glycosyltransferase involved in cell wall biosynthesis
MAGRLENLSAWLNSDLDPQIEVVLVHDKQDEKTGPELRELIAHARVENIHLVESKFGSPGAARNAGTFFASTKWLAFWDSDDIPNPRAVLLELTSIKTNVEVLIGNFTVQEPTRKYEILHKTRIQRVGINPGLWRMVFLRKAIGELIFPEYKMAEDQVYLAKFKLGLRAIHFSDSHFYTYFKGNPNQLTSQPELTNNDALIELKELIEEKSVGTDPFTQIIFARLVTSALLKNPTTFKMSEITSYVRILVAQSIKNNYYLCYPLFQKFRNRIGI